MSLFPRAFTSGGEFTPLFRLLDDYASHSLTRPQSASNLPQPSLRTFQPRFDVRETKEGYVLDGELPGIDQKDVSIEFTDPQTLQIRGRVERSYEAGTKPTAAAAIESGEEDRQSTASSDSENYHKPSVEDDEGTTAGPVAEKRASVTEEPKREADSHRYWVSERSVGEFSRSFNFPTRVDHDNVKASLRNGVLSVVIPKAAAPVARRINIE